MTTTEPATPLSSPATAQPPVNDQALYPYAQDLDGRWHRRPAGDTWVISFAEPNCRTACGMAIHSVHVSEYEPQADSSTCATLCECVTAPPAPQEPATPARVLRYGDMYDQTQQASPELAAAMAETREVRAKLADLCREFSPSPQSGWGARISLTVLNRYRDTALLDRLSRTPSNNGEDTMLRYRRERDEARAEAASLLAERNTIAGRGQFLKQQLDQANTRNTELAQALTDTAENTSRLENELEAALKQALGQNDTGQYAVIELMGHVTIIGQVTETTLAGAPVLRIDRLDGRIQRVSPQSLYRVTDITEDEARTGWAALTRWGGNLALPQALAQAQGTAWPEDNRVHDDHEHGEDGHDDSDADPF